MAKLTLCSRTEQDMKEFVESTEKQLKGQNQVISFR
jgi:hypothetical protein